MMGVVLPGGTAMSIHIQDGPTVAALETAAGIEEVFAADGRLLGRFKPAPRPGMSCPELGATDEELDQPISDPNAVWRSPEEVSARLREAGRCST